MVEIKQEEIDLILSNYFYFSENELAFYYNRLNKRLDYLRPIILEFEQKCIKLEEICPKLDKEINFIKEILLLLELFKINKQ